LQSFKSKLKLVLKENANEYWECLKKFTQAKLTKAELDTYARAVLHSDENVALHNLFIKSIFNNAYCPYGPPLPPTPTATNSSSILEMKTWVGVVNNKKKKKDKKDKKKRGREMERLDDRKKHRTEAILYGNRADFNPFNSQLHTKMLSSPQLTSLRNKMHTIATEKGLHHVSNESVAAVMTATEEFIKRLLSLLKVQQRAESSGNINSSNHVQATSIHVDASLVMPSDVHHAIVLRPYLLGEDFSVNLERISLLL